MCTCIDDSCKVYKCKANEISIMCMKGSISSN